MNRAVAILAALVVVTLPLGRSPAHRTLGHAWIVRTPEEQAHFVAYLIERLQAKVSSLQP